MAQQPAFDRQAFAAPLPGKTTQAVPGHHPMTGHGDQTGVGATGAADGPGAGAEFPGQFAIGPGGPWRDGPQRLPDAVLEGGPRQGQGQIQSRPAIAKIPREGGADGRRQG